MLADLVAYTPLCYWCLLPGRACVAASTIVVEAPLTSQSADANAGGNERCHLQRAMKGVPLVQCRALRQVTADKRDHNHKSITCVTYHLFSGVQCPAACHLHEDLAQRARSWAVKEYHEPVQQDPLKGSLVDARQERPLICIGVDAELTLLRSGCTSSLEN